MGSVRLYTYAEAPVPLVRKSPKDPFMAAGYVAGLAGVQRHVRAVAGIGYGVAKAVLAAHKGPPTQDRSSRPHIELVRGERTDWHINLVVEATGDPEAAAVAIEFGRGEYVDSKGRRQPAMAGIGALQAAWSVMAVSG